MELVPPELLRPGDTIAVTEHSAVARVAAMPAASAFWDEAAAEFATGWDIYCVTEGGTRLVLRRRPEQGQWRISARPGWQAPASRRG